MKKRSARKPSHSDLDSGLRIAARDAALQLGAAIELADAFSRGEEMPCERWFLSWAVVPRLDRDTPSPRSAILITLSLEGVEDSIGLEELQAMLELAPAFLAHKTAIGYSRMRNLCLYRLVPPSEANPKPFAKAIGQLWTLSQSLWPAGRSPAR